MGRVSDGKDLGMYEVIPEEIERAAIARYEAQSAGGDPQWRRLWGCEGFDVGKETKCGNRFAAAIEAYERERLRAETAEAKLAEILGIITRNSSHAAASSTGSQQKACG